MHVILPYTCAWEVPLRRPSPLRAKGKLFSLGATRNLKMRTVALLLGLGFALMYCPAEDLAETPQDAATKATYLVVYRPGPAWLTGKSVVDQPLKEHGKYNAEPLHQRLHEASGSSYG